ncbi:MAG: response regulator transcription factor [Chloroflexota bacterium]|nr:response regulator transcription factor [Chloroflexota bacterium]
MSSAAQSPQKKIRVLVVDDHSVVRQGLRMFLLVQPDMEMVGEAQNGREAVALAATLAPDVVLMDLLMPEMDGIAATAAIKAAHPETQVLVLTTFLDDRRVAEAIQAGAVGFLLKEVEADDLIKAVRGAARGEPQLHPDAARMLMGLATRPKPAPDHAATLTDRERDVIALLAEGRSNKQIARELSISETTVKGHVANILGKLALADRTQAAVYAVRNGLAREVRSS